MKRILSFTCAALCCMIMNAQLVTSRSVAKVSAPKESKTTWMFKVGMATNNFVGDMDDASAKIGYNLGFEFNRTIRNKGAYWGMDFLFGSRGYKMDGEGDYEYKLKAHNFQWAPFTFGWKVDITDKIAIDPHIGLFFSIDYAGKSISEYEDNENEVKIYDMDNYIPVDLGMKIGVGVWYNKKFNLDLTYQRGFVNTVDSEDYEAYASNFLIRLGYAF